MPEKTALAEFISHDRHSRKESQFTYACNCGISKEFLSLLERRKANPSLELMQNIAAYAGVTVSEMLDVNGKTKEE